MSRRRESSRRDEKKTERDRDREKDKERDRDRDREKDKERDREKDRDRERERDRDRDRERDRDRDRDRDREKDRDRDRERDRDRDREKDRDRDRDRDREKDKNRLGERRKRERSRSNDRRRRSTDRHKRRSRSSSDSSPIPEIKRRKKTGWDVMIPEEPDVAPSPVVPSMNPQQQRQQRRLYVGNLPTTVSELELMEFFNTAMANANVATTPGSPVLSAAINLEKAYAFIEFRSAEEATAGMSLDGITLQGHALRVRRPKDYQPSLSDIQGISQIESSGPRLPFPTGPPLISVNLNIVSTNVADTPYKIFIGGLPLHLNEGDVKKLLSMFGQLKSFNLVRDSVTGLSKGFAFCEYADPNVTDGACLSLNGMAVGDKTLIVQRASVNPKTKAGGASNEPINPRAANMLNLSTPAAQLLATAVKNATADPTRVLVLMNIINLSDFPGDLEESEYQEFIEDITEECSRYGKVLRILVPRPSSKQKNHTVEHFDGQDVDLDADEEDDDEEESEEEPPPPGFGKVFVEYELVEHARRAQTALSGRRYDGRMVITSFHPEEKWQHQVLEPDDIEPLYTPLIPLKSNQS